ncbi:MAG TPA: glycosyltransferase, partial [Nitrospiria bacterium]|nr:glycosyltransferase [Nitrospiria bacterium]
MDRFSMEEPFLSLIFPVYNKESLLAESLSEVLRFVGQKPFASEILLVEDGGHDRSLDILKDFEKNSNDRVRIVLLANTRNRGKGFSVRRGMEQARGKYVVFMDIDLAYPLEDIDRVLR